ncbi:MAG TPA: MFS transporter, partial [Verrucomicrobiota bacterium]|nr:MFS transporter [Verrucomicrobiota bacterium]
MNRAPISEPPAASGHAVPSRKRPVRHLRWYIAGLLCLASALNYLDRQTLSVLIGTIKEQLHLSNASYGDI